MFAIVPLLALLLLALCNAQNAAAQVVKSKNVGGKKPFFDPTTVTAYHPINISEPDPESQVLCGYTVSADTNLVPVSSRVFKVFC